jgi:predicted transcriptional regulator
VIVNDEIRRLVKETMAEKGLSQQAVADALGLKRPNITRMLSGRSGQVPVNWQGLFDLLGVEPTIRPKPGAGGGE